MLVLRVQIYVTGNNQATMPAVLFVQQGTVTLENRMVVELKTKENTSVPTLLLFWDLL